MRVEIGDEAKKWCAAVPGSRLALGECVCAGVRTQITARCRSEHCLKTFYESYDFANRTLSMLLGCGEELIQWGPPLGPPLDEWYNCAGRRGQPFCPGIYSTAQRAEDLRDTGQDITVKRPLLQ